MLWAEAWVLSVVSGKFFFFSDHKEASSLSWGFVLGFVFFLLRGLVIGLFVYE